MVVVLSDGRYEEAFVVETLDRLAEEPVAFDLLALDIPIGLPPDGLEWPRGADLEARGLVGPKRSSSVFLSPPRPVLGEATYDLANDRHRRLTGKGLSQQTWGLRRRILEADAYVSDHPATIEAHPEVCFRVMNGAPLEARKKSWNGQMQRRTLLAARGVQLPDSFDGPTGNITPDDILDAAAVAWTAWRHLCGRAGVLPGDALGAPVEQRGLIWY